eukprot:3011175-Lingulodinium_polyedra.AAC.1
MACRQRPPTTRTMKSARSRWARPCGSGQGRIRALRVFGPRRPRCCRGRALGVPRWPSFAPS